jgi:hypothetical protein
MQPFAFTHPATNTHKMRGINYTYGMQSCKKINSRSHQKGGKKERKLPLLAENHSGVAMVRGFCA